MVLKQAKMGRIYFGAKAKAWVAKRKGIETRPIKAESDNDSIVPLRRPIGERIKRDSGVVAKAKHGKEFCEHCRWTPPAPRMLHAHHVFPISFGGSDTLDNLIVLCPNCHAVAHPFPALCYKRSRLELKQNAGGECAGGPTG